MQIYEADNSTNKIHLAQLKRQPIRPEAALESILHANPQLVLDEPLLIIGRQVPLATGVADLIACDQFGNVVVIEVKIGRSGTGSASEETILSQPQAYASDLSNFDYDALNEMYQDYRTRLDEGEWDVIKGIAPKDNLQSAIGATFGKELTHGEFNTEQRLVVVAEEITQRTSANARYLIEQGLHFQCTEVRRFVKDDSTTNDSVLASSVVVNYDLNRVRPPNRPSPIYPDLVAGIVEPIFPEIRETVGASSPSEVFPDGFDVRGPALESRFPDHPEGIIYYVSPEPDNERVTIGVHNMNELPEAGERIRAEQEKFEQAGLTVKNNPRYNLVWKRWSVESLEDVWDLQPEISEHYKQMVLLGHEVLVR